MHHARDGSSSCCRRAVWRPDKRSSPCRARATFPVACRDFNAFESRREPCTVSERKKKKPERVANIVADVLARRGLSDRVEQAGIIPEWAQLVGEQIAAVTEPRSVSANGTLFVAVTTNAWMNELSLLEPELLRSLNARATRAPIKRIRWQLRR